VFGAQARFSKKSVTISGRASQYVRLGDSGSRVAFHFCPECGATVYWDLQGHEEYVAIPVGAFADRQFPPPAFSVYEERMHPWVRVPDDIEHMP
jgi:hypothetical protein